MQLYPTTGLEGAVATLNGLFKSRELQLAHGKDVAQANLWLENLVDKLLEPAIWEELGQCTEPARAELQINGDAAIIGIRYPKELSPQDVETMGLDPGFYFKQDEGEWHFVEVIPRCPPTPGSI